MAHPCQGCYYFRGRSTFDRCCNYIFITGHRRPCPPGKACTVRRRTRKHAQKSQKQ